MSKPIKLSILVEQIHDTIHNRFDGETFWITAEITDLKATHLIKQYRFLQLVEKDGNNIVASINAVFWQSYLKEIDKFEKLTQRNFDNGLEITCKVRVNFTMRYGLKLEVLEIDPSHTLGALELERQRTLERLIKENPKTIRLVDGQYRTLNNSLPLPLVIQNIALITAPDSDGQRDFKNETTKNKYGYSFYIKEFLTTIQGDTAHKLILQQLQLIEKSQEKFDVVVIVRGGGSQTDFKPFEEYDLAKCIATFPIPVLTGIGHDRNTSIVDLMARQHKTPTKVATFILDQNFSFEKNILDLKGRLTDMANDLIESAKTDLREMKRLVKSLSPSSVLNRGFAIITINGKIITNPKDIKLNSQLQTLLKNETIYSTVNKKSQNEKRLDI